MFDEKNRFIIPDYQNKPTFSSFLPGIGGEMGVPMWCYYNNRGQAVCSFGVSDKDHAIMEFCPAHVAYRDVSRTGFRTFCKVNGQYRELFTDHPEMHIGMSEVEIVEQAGDLSASALYFGVPGERSPALARVLKLRNEGKEPVTLEMLDGMPALVPYGINQDMLKNMTQLSKAWMQVEDHEKGLSYFRVRASTADTAMVTMVEEGNFCLAWDEKFDLLCPLVQSSLVFGEDTSFAVPRGFLEKGIQGLCRMKQVTQNQFPCCFLPKEITLAPGEETAIYSLYGQAEDKGRVRQLADTVTGIGWFEEKRREAAKIVEDLCGKAECKTADPIFDAYSKQAYLDNLLRGGAPMLFTDGEKTAPFYLYSRKHGDPEREYNYFSLGREYYAQGNGNFRDVNQNRRCDVQFTPKLGRENIHTFFDLIQTDGYNPLVVTPSTFTLPEEERARFALRLPQAEKLLSGPFTPGALAMAAEDGGMTKAEAHAFTAQAVCAAVSEANADFGEGYWSDHWTYNLDLIESYLGVFPEEQDDLLFGDRRYRYYETKVLINPRAKRYEKTKNGLRQYHALDTAAKDTTRKWMCTEDGQEARSTLIEKMILLCTLKTATLDPAGMGVEMEGGKPGWYDALNGLPGLLGSSMAESCELARLLHFTVKALEQRGGEIELYREAAELLDGLDAILAGEQDAYTIWNRENILKENYREKTKNGYQGQRKAVDCAVLAQKLSRLEETVQRGISAACEIGGGVIPTYFIFNAVSVADTPEGPMPLKLEAQPMALFLEGPVHYLKLSVEQGKKEELARQVKASPLYDKKLHMYKVNASLQNESFEVGRAKAFTPGWLENESIWLHMEYKYLLELLKSGLYGEFSEAFHDAAVPFLNWEQYGRSPLENVSFLASSANPDPAVHGRGFVARLSGSTAEFLQIWQIMFFGKQPFRLENGELQLELAPCVPGYLLPESGRVEAVFLGGIPVTYATAAGELTPGKTRALRYTLTYSDGAAETVEGCRLSGKAARAVRDGGVKALLVELG